MYIVVGMLEHIHFKCGMDRILSFTGGFSLRGHYLN